VPDHRLSHRLQRRGGNFDGTWNVKFDVGHAGVGGLR
jgi:hypothetical protein